jgi:Plus-3 domain
MAKKQVPNEDESELYHSPEDRDELLSLPEVERERILYERHKEMERKRERRELEKRRGAEMSMVEKRSGVDVSYHTFAQTVLKREDLVRMMYRPFMHRVAGCHVKIRVSAGYKVLRIRRVRDGRIYSIEGKGKSDKWLEVEGGGLKMDVSIENASNSKVSEEEFRVYIEDGGSLGEKEGRSVGRRIRSELDKKVDEREMEYILREKRKFVNEGKMSAKMQIDLMAKLSEAREEGSEEKVKAIEAELRRG